MLPKIKQELVAVQMLDAVIKRVCSQEKSPSAIAETAVANIETRVAATMACTWTRAMLPTIILITSR